MKYWILQDIIHLIMMIVKKEIEVLYANLSKNNIDGQRFVVDHIKRPLRDYAECYNLKGVTTRILNK